MSLNFDSEIIINSSVTHYVEKKRKFEEIQKQETDANVRSWVKYYIDSLDRSLKRDLAREERDPK